MKRVEAISRLKGVETEIRALGAAHLFLFGSTGRDEADGESDVDVFIDRDPAVPFGMIELTNLGFMLEEVLGVKVDVGTRKGLHRAIRAEVERSAVQVF